MTAQLSLSHTKSNFIIPIKTAHNSYSNDTLVLYPCNLYFILQNKFGFQLIFFSAKNSINFKKNGTITLRENVRTDLRFSENFSQCTLET